MKREKYEATFYIYSWNYSVQSTQNTLPKSTNNTQFVFMTTSYEYLDKRHDKKKLFTKVIYVSKYVTLF